MINLSQTVKDNIAKQFTQQEARAVQEAVASYGANPSHQEAERVQLAILHLAKGDLKKLLHYVEVAKVDYRDILSWEELDSSPPPSA